MSARTVIPPETRTAVANAYRTDPDVSYDTLCERFGISRHTAQRIILEAGAQREKRKRKDTLDADAFKEPEFGMPVVRYRVEPTAAGVCRFCQNTGVRWVNGLARTCNCEKMMPVNWMGL